MGADTTTAAVAVEKKPLFSSERGGLIFVFMAGLLYSVQSVGAQYIKEEGIPSYQVIFVRATIQGLVLAGTLKWRGKPLLGPTGVKKWVATRGAMGGFAFMTLFHSVTVLPIGDATTLFTLHPIVTIFAARAILGDPIQPMLLVAVAASLVGMCFVTQPTFLFPAPAVDNTTAAAVDAKTGVFYSRTAGIIAALTTSVFSGLIFVLIKYTSNKKASSSQQLFAWSVSAAIFSTIMQTAVDPFVNPGLRGWCLIFGVAAIGTAGHWSMNFGARLAPSGQASLMRTLDIVYGYAWDILLFDRFPNAMTITGVVLILMGIGMIVLVRSMAGKSFCFAAVAEAPDAGQDSGASDDEMEMTLIRPGDGEGGDTENEGEARDAEAGPRVTPAASFTSVASVSVPSVLVADAPSRRASPPAVGTAV